MLRVTSGKYKGRVLTIPAGEIRPTTALMREIFFDLIDDVGGRSFCDIFAGSGVMSIEAASRGADCLTLVEKDRRKKNVLLKNLSLLAEPYNLKLMPAESFVRLRQKQYDIIYLDPPYRYRFKEDILKRILSVGLLTSDGIAAIHLPYKERLPEQIGDYRLYRQKKSGQAALCFYRQTL